MSGLGRAFDIPILIGRDDARRLAEQELARAKYGGTPDWVAAALDRIQDLVHWFLDLLSRVSAPPPSGGGINWGFLAVVLVLLATVAVVIWRVGLPRWRRRSAGGAVEADPSVEAVDYRARADAAAAAGAWREAVGDRFRALVRELETRTILDVRPARTALEAAAGAGRQLPTLAGGLWAGADEFNAVVYGEAPADAAAYARMVALDEAVTAAADRVDLAADVEPTAVRS
ncbi:MAG TPA: DUF4129 domain-containing protein [Microlunatus sp.]|nr:DUF4129 domain-containing protein [Microlunatus sp.]